MDWLRVLKSNELSGVRYGIFGCGNRDWVQTYQRVPTLCDTLMEQHGGKRLIIRGEGDASASDFFEVFDEFEAKLWELLSKVHKCHFVDMQKLTIIDLICRNSRLQRTQSY